MGGEFQRLPLFYIVKKKKSVKAMEKEKLLESMTNLGSTPKITSSHFSPSLKLFKSYYLAKIWAQISVQKVLVS